MKITPEVLIQDIITSNAGAWLSNATLRFFSLAKHCIVTFNIFILSVDFDAVETEFGPLIW